MSVLNQSGEEQVECPLCMEALEVDDLHFYPCTCGYQICRFCWNRIREGENGLCPACRKAYPENPADFTPLSQEQVAAMKTEKKARETKRRNKTLESRKALANVRVVQSNLVFVVGLPVRLADPEILKRQEYFGKYGKIHKVVINQSTTYAGSQGPSASAYVTYLTSADALRAIQGVNNVTLDGRVLKGSLGTTKYCANFMKNQPCPKPDCMYLHELGDPKASFSKEEMHAGLHQVYERKLHNALIAQTRDKENGTGNSSTNVEKGSSKDGTNTNFTPTTEVTSSHINVVNSSRSTNRGGGSSSSSSSASGSGKDAWPSLSSSPPQDKPVDFKSQETGTPESNSPTQQLAPQPSTHKGKEKHTEPTSKKRNKDSHTNGQTKKNKDREQKSEPKPKQKNGHSITDNSETESLPEPQPAVCETESQETYLSNELDELESDRHSLLENHNSDHSLIEDNTHSLLNDAKDRHEDMLAFLNDSNNMIQKPVANGFGLLDRERDMYDRVNQMSLLEQKEMMLRERSRSEMVMRQNEMMRQHGTMMEPKHYMPTSSVGMDSNDLLGANYHPNHNMLPFGMRVDNSMASNPLVSNPMASNPLSANQMASNSLSANHMASNQAANPHRVNPLSNSLSMNSMPYMMHSQQVMQHNQQMQLQGMVNGFDGSHNAGGGRYQSDNVDKFFTDFNKTQQMRLLLLGGAGGARAGPHNMLSAERLEMQHKQRLGSPGAAAAAAAGGAGRAAGGDCDDDLDFDPFKETQKALAEMMMESDHMQSSVDCGDNNMRAAPRLPPPGFGHAAFPMQQQQQQQQMQRNNMQQQQQGYGRPACYNDWTAMDPAIMSTSVNMRAPAPAPAAAAPAPALSQQQHELFARFHQLKQQRHLATKPCVPAPLLGGPAPGAPPAGAGWGAAPSRQLWPGSLPPGFASPPQPPQPPRHPQHTQECIDAK